MNKIYYYFINITYKPIIAYKPSQSPELLYTLGVVCSVKLTKDIVKINLIKVYSKNCKKIIFSEKLNNTAKSLIENNSFNICREVVLDNPFNSIDRVNRELVRQEFNEDIKQICIKHLSQLSCFIVSSFLI